MMSVATTIGLVKLWLVISIGTIAALPGGVRLPNG